MSDHRLLERAARYVAAEHFIPENAQLLARKASSWKPRNTIDQIRTRLAAWVAPRCSADVSRVQHFAPIRVTTTYVEPGYDEREARLALCGLSCGRDCPDCPECPEPLVCPDCGSDTVPHHDSWGCEYCGVVW